jgi:hypothetical protein
MKRSTRLLVLSAALIAASAAPVAAQDMKASILDDFRRMRENTLMMIDAMPESGLRSAPTDGVRDFAQQIEHVVQGTVSIVGTGLDRPAPGYGNPEVYLNNKAELVAFTNRGFDAVDATVSGWSVDDLGEETNLFGQAMVQRWKLAGVAHEHAVWTLGSTVPYVRLQGGAPAGFDLVPSGN